MPTFPTASAVPLPGDSLPSHRSGRRCWGRWLECRRRPRWPRWPGTTTGSRCSRAPASAPPPAPRRRPRRRAAWAPWWWRWQWGHNRFIYDRKTMLFLCNIKIESILSVRWLNSQYVGQYSQSNSLPISFLFLTLFYFENRFFKSHYKWRDFVISGLTVAYHVIPT